MTASLTAQDAHALLVQLHDRYGLSPDLLGWALKVDARTAARWLTNGPSRRLQPHRVLDLKLLCDTLDETLEAGEIREWLISRNPYLPDHRPPLTTLAGNLSDESFAVVYAAAQIRVEYARRNSTGLTDEDQRLLVALARRDRLPTVAVLHVALRLYAGQTGVPAHIPTEA